MPRRTKGVDHVDEIQGSRESKRRAKVILKTLSGELSVREGCEQLGIGPTQFANLRMLFLRYGIDGLEPRRVGRPPRHAVASSQEVELLQRIAELERQNQLLQAQVEVAALRRGREAMRSKSDREVAAPLASSRPRRAERAVSQPGAASETRPSAQGSDGIAEDGPAGAARAAP
jgi:hypothetical protein